MSLLEDEVIGIFGFGSFFRNEPFKDVDILIVAEKYISNSAVRSNRLRGLFAAKGVELGVVFDVKIFTFIEFMGKPLTNMSDLVEIVPISEKHQAVFGGVQALPPPLPERLRLLGRRLGAPAFGR